MQLTIIGAGAIGGTIGAHLIRDGHDILFCDADAAHVDVINQRGLTICGPVENFTVQARAVLPDALPPKLTRAAVAVKSHHTAAAAELLRGRLDPDGYVVSFQNGLNTDTLAAVVGPSRVIASFVNFGADLLEPGRIMQGNVGTFRVGEPGGGISERVLELADALPYAQATGNIMGFLWGKEAYGAMLWAGAVSDLSIADSLDDPKWRPLMLAIAREVLAQAPVRPEGFDGFEPDDLEGSLDRLVTFNRQSAKSHSGIYRDLMVRKRKTEVDGQLGDLNGPLTFQTAELIRAIERGERTCEVANLELLASYEAAIRLGEPLNAVVSLLPAPARQPGGDLHGVPIAVKDLIDIAGNPRGNGNPHDMSGPAAAVDAPVITALREAGADVFATTSLLEYAAGATHPDVPEARNPVDRQRTAGGSSGGSAALVGAGACPVALGTDTGGSIRIPAHYCGIVGFKPSFGAIEVAGVQPLAPSLDHVGILGADVAITEKVFAALDRPAPGRPSGRTADSRRPAAAAAPGPPARRRRRSPAGGRSAGPGLPGHRGGRIRPDRDSRDVRRHLPVGGLAGAPQPGRAPPGAVRPGDAPAAPHGRHHRSRQLSGRLPPPRRAAARRGGGVPRRGRAAHPGRPGHRAGHHPAGGHARRSARGTVHHRLQPHRRAGAGAPVRLG